jgi:hypothetical protein
MFAYDQVRICDVLCFCVNNLLLVRWAPTTVTQNTQITRVCLILCLFLAWIGKLGKPRNYYLFGGGAWGIQ